MIETTGNDSITHSAPTIRDCLITDESIEESVMLESPKKFQAELASWAIQSNTSHASIESLLAVMARYPTIDTSSLPKTARGLLGTKSEIVIRELSGMKYFYFGIEEQLSKILSNSNCPAGDVQLAINVDGLPLFKSSSTSCWPVLCRIVNIEKSKVFPIALTVGNNKPTDLEFLTEAG